MSLFVMLKQARYFRKNQEKPAAEPTARALFWRKFLLICAVLGLVAFLIVWFVVLKPYRDRADSYDLSKINDVEIPSVIYDRNQREIGRIFVQNRSLISFDQVPENFKHALVSGEDSRFWSHGGIDFFGIGRAVVALAKTHEVSQGASTLTQQLARNAYDLKGDAVKRGESGFKRKIVEAFLARRIEAKFTKSEIMNFYLNRIYFGSGYYGLRSAALGYFGKEPKDLSVSECASIVGLIKNPTLYSPLNSLTANKKTRDNVLRRMQEDGFITSQEQYDWSAKDVVLNPKPLQRGVTHFFDRVTDEIRTQLGDEALSKGGYRIYTTLLKEIQDAAERSVAKKLDEIEAREDYANAKFSASKAKGIRDFLQGSVLMLDNETGEILAYVGGRDYAQVPYDFISQGRRPLGTAFFPFVYAAGLERGETWATLTDDEPMDNRMVMIGGREGVLGEWGMEVAHPRYEGKITAAKAFQFSKIAATVRYGTKIGVKSVVDTAKAMGLPISEKDATLPRTLVGWEPTSLPEILRAMAAFPRGGRLGNAEPFLVKRVQDAEGVVRYEHPDALPKVVSALRSDTAYLVHHVLHKNLMVGSAAGCAKGLVQKPFIGGAKGGTTENFSDAWFVGYNARISCGVWVGFLQGNRTIYPGAFSRDVAMPIWQEAMNAATPSFGGNEIRRPANLVDVAICSVSGMRATPFCYQTLRKGEKAVSTETLELFVKGTENLPFCTVHSGGGNTANPAVAAGDLSDPLEQLSASNALPIRPQDAVVIGKDPYDAITPDYENQEKRQQQGGGVDLLEHLNQREWAQPTKTRETIPVPIHDEE